MKPKKDSVFQRFITAKRAHERKHGKVYFSVSTLDANGNRMHSSVWNRADMLLLIEAWSAAVEKPRKGRRAPIIINVCRS